MRKTDIDKAIYEGWKVRDVSTGRTGVVDCRMNAYRLYVTEDNGKRFQAHYGKLVPLGEATRRYP